jgi:2-methylcitrate dehydratase
MNDGRKIVDELAVANAHTLGARPFARADYVRKFETLTEGLISPGESTRFLDLVQRLPSLTAAEVGMMNVVLDGAELVNGQRDTKGIF